LNITSSISNIARAKRRADSHNRNVIIKRRTQLSQSAESASDFMDSSKNLYDEVRIPADADLTVWVCIGMHVISVDGEVSEALPLVPIEKQVEELHRPHHPPHIGMALFQGEKKNPRVQFERALKKYSGSNWNCKISASRRRDALSSAESNGERSFVVSKKWCHLAFDIKEQKMSRTVSDDSVDSSMSMASHYVSLSTIDVDLKLLPQRAPRLPLPSHFYGEIGKTKEGAKRLKNSGHMEKLCARVYDEDFSTLYRRAAMIALAHIGSSDTGFRVLNQCAPDFVPYCLNLVKKTDSKLSLRGTVFVVAGLVSQSSLGRQMLADHGWSSPESPASVSMPTDTTSVFNLQSNITTPSEKEEEIKISTKTADEKKPRRRPVRGASVASIYLVPAKTDDDGLDNNDKDEKKDIPDLLRPKLAEIHTEDGLNDVRKQIMEHIVQLSNGIINATARKRLLELKESSRSPRKGISRKSPFMDPSFFSLVLRQTLNASSLTLASRQFVLYELFGELLEQNGMSLLAEEMSASSRPTTPSSSRASSPKSVGGMRRSPSREFRLDFRE